MSEVIRFCGVALICACACVILKQFKGDISPLVRIGGAAVLFSALALYVGGIISELLSVLNADGIESYAAVLLKALGIAFITKICTGICKDLGESTLADGVGIGGKLAILSLCLPLIGDLMTYASEMLKLR